MRRVILILALLTCSAAGQTTSKSIDLPEGIARLTLSPAGMTAAMDESGRALLLYPKLTSAQTLEGEIKVPLNGKPVALVHKPTKDGGLFAVADDQRTIHLVGDRSGKLVGSVKVEKEIFDLAAPPSAESNFIFYSIGGERNNQQTIGRIDLSNMRDAGFFDTNDTGFNDIYSLEAAADGRTIYLARPNTNPTGIYALQIDPSDPNRLVKVFDQHDSVQGYVPAASGIGTGINHSLYSTDLNTMLRELPARVVCMMNTRPVIFTLSEDRTSITAFSINSGKQLGMVKMPTQEKTRKPPRREENSGRRKLDRIAFVDEASGNVLIFNNRAAVVIPLSQFNLPQEPLMAVQIDGPRDLAVNEPWSANVVALDKGFTVALGQAPDGMKLEGDKLTWTPPLTSVGPAKVSLSLQAGDVKTQQQINLVVRQRATKLPVWVANFVVTPDGTKLIAIGANEQRQGQPNQENRSSRFIAVDLASQKILFDQRVDFVASAFDASNTALYLAAQQTDAIYSLPFDKPDAIEKVFTNGNVNGLAVAGDRLYANVQNRNGGPAGPSAYRLPKLEPIDPPETNPNLYVADNQRLPSNIGDGWLTSEAVWENDFSKARLLLQTPTIPMIAYMQGNGGPFDRGEPVARWGTVFNGNQIRRVSGQAIAQPENIAGGCLLVDLPAAVGLRVKRDYDQERRMIMLRAELGVFDLVDGKEDKIVLMNEPAENRNVNDDNRFNRRNVIASTPEKILAVVGDRLFVIPTSLLNKERFREPLYFAAETKPIIASTADVVKVNYTVRGGEKPLRFNVAQDMPGIEIDKESGELRVDASKLLTPQKIDEVLNQLGQMSGRQSDVAGGAPTTAPSNITEMAAKQSRAVERWIGAKPAGIPLAIRVGVRARDARQQEAQLDHVVLLDVPTDVLQKRWDERAEKMRQQMEQQRKQQQQFEQNRVQQTGDSAALQKRVRDLELENERLKAQVEVLKSLQQGNSTPATSPAK